MAKNQVPRVEISDAQWRDIRRLWKKPNNKTTKEIVAELQFPFSSSSLGTKMRERGMEPNKRRAHMGLSKLSLPAANR
jgi:hypothetical protein